MTNALRTTTLAVALSACETRDPLAQADQVCVAYEDNTHFLKNDRTYPGAHPHAEASSIQSLILSEVQRITEQHNVNMCAESSAPNHVAVHTTIEGAYGVALQPVDEQVSNNSDLSVLGPIPAKHLVQLGMDGLGQGCDYSWLSASNYRNGHDFADAVGEGLDRTLDCTLKPQYHWKW